MASQESAKEVWRECHALDVQTDKPLLTDCAETAWEQRFIPLLVFLLLGLVGLTKSYDLLNKPVCLKASPFTSILLGAAFTVNVLQVVAIFGMMTL